MSGENPVRPVFGAIILVLLIMMSIAIMNKIHRDRMARKAIPDMTAVSEEAKSFLETPTTGVVSGQNQNVKESDLGPVRVRQTVNPGIKE